jgi:hypothetical protein
MTALRLVLLAVLFACRASGSSPDPDAGDSGSGAAASDRDGDGVSAEDGDCDDTDPAVRPGAAEQPYDGVDQDCDPATDDADMDADGVPVADDCDDADAAVLPGAVEVCDGVDNDCDGGVDRDAVDGLDGWTDADVDGFGDASAPGRFCASQSGWALGADDCADDDPSAYPGAPETCDGADDDCDGTADEEAVDAVTWYADADGDGFGAAGSGVAACAAPPGTVADATDCDDAADAVYPGAAEVDPDLDEDCDGAP